MSLFVGILFAVSLVSASVFSVSVVSAAEVSSDDSSGSLGFPVRSADLSVSAIAADTTPYRVILVTVCNNGGVSSGEVQVDTQRIGMGAPRVVHHLVGVSAVAPGECKTNGTGGAAYFDAVPGETYYFRATVDPKNILSEFNEENNSLEQKVTIPPLTNQSIVVTTPEKSGAVWNAGQTYNIFWGGGGTDWSVNVLLIEAGKETARTKEIALSIKNTGFYSWTIPRDLEPGEYFIRVACQSCKMGTTGWFGDGPVFTINGSVNITKPIVVHTPENVGETWYIGDTRNITWSGGEANWLVNVLLNDRENTKTKNIALSIKNTGSYAWTIPDGIAPGKYVITVACQSCASGASGWYDDSNVFVVDYKDELVVKPVLVFKGTESYSTNDGQFVRYRLSVTNRSSFPDTLFEVAPSLPACGLNVNSSRTWVEIFEANGKRIYGFCGLKKAAELDDLWFAIKKGSTPPLGVYISLIDRKAGKTYRSNVVWFVSSGSGGGGGGGSTGTTEVGETEVETEVQIRTDESKEDSVADEQLQTIGEKAYLLKENNVDSILRELKELRNIIKEQETEIKYLRALTSGQVMKSEEAKEALSNFITYGVDDNTQKLGAGERAAVMYSYKSAFGKLPESEDELTDAIKIANGRWPEKKSAVAESRAKIEFKNIYKREANLQNGKDNAAVTVMAYGLRQKAENRKLESEKKGIEIFEDIYGRTPNSTNDWNIMQAITYSGATR